MNWITLLKPYQSIFQPRKVWNIPSDTWPSSGKKLGLTYVVAILIPTLPIWGWQIFYEAWPSGYSLSPIGQWVMLLFLGLWFSLGDASLGALLYAIVGRRNSNATLLNCFSVVVISAGPTIPLALAAMMTNMPRAIANLALVYRGVLIGLGSVSVLGVPRRRVPGVLLILYLGLIGLVVGQSLVVYNMLIPIVRAVRMIL